MLTHPGTFVVATLVALLATPAAVAHGGGAARGYASSVTALTPATEAVHVAVLDARRPAATSCVSEGAGTRC